MPADKSENEKIIINSSFFFAFGIFNFIFLFYDKISKCKAYNFIINSMKKLTGMKKLNFCPLLYSG